MGANVKLNFHQNIKSSRAPHPGPPVVSTPLFR